MAESYMAFFPRYCLVNFRVNLISRLCGPPWGSLARTTRMSPNRTWRIEAGREPAGASRRRNSTASIRSSPSLKHFSVVCSVVWIWSFRSASVMDRFSRRSDVSLYFLCNSTRACDASVVSLRQPARVPHQTQQAVRLKGPHP